MLARNKLNSIESKDIESKALTKNSIESKALTKNEISHEGFMRIANEEKKYRELKESIRMI